MMKSVARTTAPGLMQIGVPRVIQGTTCPLFMASAACSSAPPSVLSIHPPGSLAWRLFTEERSRLRRCANRVEGQSGLGDVVLQLTAIVG